MNNVTFADILFVIVVSAVTVGCIWLSERGKRRRSGDDR